MFFFNMRGILPCQGVYHTPRGKGVFNDGIGEFQGRKIASFDSGCGGLVTSQFISVFVKQMVQLHRPIFNLLTTY